MLHHLNIKWFRMCHNSTTVLFLSWNKVHVHTFDFLIVYPNRINIPKMTPELDKEGVERWTDGGSSMFGVNLPMMQRSDWDIEFCTRGKGVGRCDTFMAPWMPVDKIPKPKYKLTRWLRACEDLAEEQYSWMVANSKHTANTHHTWLSEGETIQNYDLDKYVSGTESNRRSFRVF